MSSSQETVVLRNVNVKFPFVPYQVQKVLMERIIEALQTRTNALLESPTGTGKSLSLLCATRAWQNAEVVSDGSARPVIVYASRTHAQLEQVAKELQRTAYHGGALILGSRETSCCHRDISRLKGREQIASCRQLVDAQNCEHREIARMEAANAKQIPDIEDLVVKPDQVPRHSYCPYYYSRDLLGSDISVKLVNIVFTPYNYLVDPATRRGLNIPWQNAVVVIDEAHNIEDVSEDACSFSLTKSQLAQAITEIEALYRDSLSKGGHLAQYELDTEVLSRVRALFKGLNEAFEKRYREEEANTRMGVSTTRKGSEIFSIVGAEGLTFENYHLLLGILEACVDALAPHSGGFTEWVIKCLTRAFELGGESIDVATAKHAADEFYRFSFERNDDAGGGWKLNFWCFSPGVALNELVKLGVRSIIMASGTLAPLDSFASSLRLSFPIRLESPHVVANDHVWLGVIPTGVMKKNLNCSYEKREDVSYQTDLGRTLVNLARLIPDGILVFFPSYAFLRSCMNCWKSIDPKIWEALVRTKDAIVIEERGSNMDVEEQYDAALGTGGGAMLFAVCRGKASEGMDFRDKRARGVIIVGLPFPASQDARIKAKRTYMDETRSMHPELRFITGQQWYSQQAYRAVNQAVGRAIRHAHDYGAIILLDERFRSFRDQLSMWLRPFFRVCEKGMDDAIPSLVQFFRSMKDKAARVPAMVQRPDQSSSFSAKNNNHKNTNVKPTIARSSLNLPPKPLTKALSNIPSSSSSTWSQSSFAMTRGATPATSSMVSNTTRAPTSTTSMSSRSSASSANSNTVTAKSADRAMEPANKKPKINQGDDTSIKEYLASCKAALKDTGFQELKALLKDFFVFSQTQSQRTAPELNQRAIDLFSKIDDKANGEKLLLKLAGFLTPLLGRALQRDYYNKRSV